ncbi:hypothetical protein BP00DRAFT_276246 [Aspergillus indologenus CBS 114.80]|uniref:Uncharacterized protein n=1 Tax=Aspergillus indologenus CBS 114.80 TaxID=1450541 RepID=A0A2V5J356_9EURO|nr:hypothetical protein BP00DRAFT_276246 [Aspergillus indologenus CBS 114.80]
MLCRARMFAWDGQRPTVATFLTLPTVMLYTFFCLIGVTITNESFLPPSSVPSLSNMFPVCSSVLCWRVRGLQSLVLPGA